MCCATQTSLLYNTFGVISETGLLQVFGFAKTSLQQLQVLNIQSLMAVNFHQSIVCSAYNDSVTISGVDQQFNDLKAMQQFKTQLIDQLTPFMAQMQ